MTTSPEVFDREGLAMLTQALKESGCTVAEATESFRVFAAWMAAADRDEPTWPDAMRWRP